MKQTGRAGDLKRVNLRNALLSALPMRRHRLGGGLLKWAWAAQQHGQATERPPLLLTGHAGASARPTDSAGFRPAACGDQENLGSQVTPR